MLISTTPFPTSPLITTTTITTKTSASATQSSNCTFVLSQTHNHRNHYCIPLFPVAGPRKPSRRRRRPRRKADMSVSAPVPHGTSYRRDRDFESFLLSVNDSREVDVLTTDKGSEGRSSSKVSLRRKNYAKTWFKCFGVDMSADTIAVAMVYFVQGVLGLARLAVSFYLKDDLHLDPAETALISGISAFPWLVKPLYGFISDSIPLFGYRRRSYLVLSGLLGAFSWSLMATIVDSKYSAALCILLGSLSVAFSDVFLCYMIVTM